MFSIIVLAVDKPDQTQRCLDSLLESLDHDWELIVVDNGSSESCASRLRQTADRYNEAGKPFTLIRNDKNLGAITGRNQGIAEARGEFVVFLDNDMVVGDRAWLSKLRAALETEPRAGIVVPRLVFADDPSTIQCAGCGVSKSGRVKFIGRGERADDARFGARREVQCGISACMMLKRAVIEEIGELDEVYNPVQFEDLDYCYRAREAGWKVIYEPAVTMLHDESTTTAGSAGFNNAYTVVKHGMIFKKRWRHMFEHEDGPADEETAWKRIGRFARDPKGDDANDGKID